METITETPEKLKQRGFDLFAAREQASAQITNINNELQKIFNEIDKLAKQAELTKQVKPKQAKPKQAKIGKVETVLLTNKAKD